MSNGKEAKHHNAEDKKNWLEWAVFAVSLLLVLAILTYLAYQVYYRKPSSPDLSVQSIADPTAHDPYRYHITVYNKGGATAEEVIVELIVEKENIALERSELQLPFLPQESKREAWVSFRRDPTQADTLLARIMSYKKP